VEDRPPRLKLAIGLSVMKVSNKIRRRPGSNNNRRWHPAGGHESSGSWTASFVKQGGELAGLGWAEAPWRRSFWPSPQPFNRDAKLCLPAPPAFSGTTN